jgi:hypothetical protein
MLAPIDSYGKLKLLLHYLREFPLVWFAIGLGIARLGIYTSGAFSVEHRFVWLRRCAFAASLFVLCAYLTIALDSLRCLMIQQDEANIISISAATLRGLPMYHPPLSPNFSYSLMYGPLTFLIYSVALVAGGVNHFWIMRGAVVMAALLLCAALFFLLRKFVSVVSSFLEVEFLAVLLTGIFGGAIIGLKISAAPALLFPLLLLYRKFGFRALAYSLLATIATTLAPFAVPNISLHNYIAWIQFTRSEGISAASALSNVLFAIFLISPCLIMELYMRRFGLAFRKRVPEFLIILLCLGGANLETRFRCALFVACCSVHRRLYGSRSERNVSDTRRGSGNPYLLHRGGVYSLRLCEPSTRLRVHQIVHHATWRRCRTAITRQIPRSISGPLVRSNGLRFS